jgi:type IV secretory pathway TraG/TraD family ATPase VirD4
VIIFGSAGSGKTESTFVPILKHAGLNDIPCLCYDYKAGELTEIANFFFQNSKIKVSTIIPHKPQYSDRTNPFAVKYLNDEATLRQLTKNIFANLRKADDPTMRSSSSGFFDKIPESTLASIIWRLRCDFPQYCTLPHAVAIGLTMTPHEIADFISKNLFSRAIGTPLVDSLKSDNQIAGVKASLSLPLTDLALPSIFWVLSGDDVSLDINNPDNPTFLSIVNDPSLEKVNAPFISLITSVVINQMRVRNRPTSFLLFDEGTTFAMDNISRIPSTMRSFNIATIFSTQDKALAKETYGDVITNSLLSNLSYQFIGKTNDPESVRYYKQISEEIEKTTTSKSFKSGLLDGDTRYSESTRDTNKYKNQDFTGLKPGQFFLFADGKDKLYNFAMTPYQRVPGTMKHHLTPNQIQENYEKIFIEARTLIGQ